MDVTAKVVKHLTYPLWVSKNRSSRLRCLAALEQTQFLSGEELRRLQWRRLKRLLEHAYANCLYYKRLFDSLGANPNDINSYGRVRGVALSHQDEFLKLACCEARLDGSDRPRPDSRERLTGEVDACLGQPWLPDRQRRQKHSESARTYVHAPPVPDGLAMIG